MEVKIREFKSGTEIPRAHSCDGSDRMPTVVIKDAPSKTVTLALIVDDPDATGGGVWDHCVLYNIPPETKEIHTKNIDSFRFGLNSWGKERYGGPCPPPGDDPHRYYFKLYALDTELSFTKPPTAEQLAQEMKRHILKEVSYMGFFGR